MEKLITDIAAVLTSDQQVLYKQLQEEAAAERKKHTRKNWVIATFGRWHCLGWTEENRIIY